VLTSQRKRHILDVLQRDGQVVAKQLGLELGTSEDTIRRDLRELAKEGHLLRVHGGALPASLATGDYTARLSVATDEKIALGRAAAGIVQRDQTIILDGGTTAVQIVRHLSPDLRATVITHSPTIAVELVDRPKINVILIGGTLFRHSIVAVGAAAIEAIQKVRADIYFMGVTGIQIEAGLTTGDFEEAHVKKALSASSAETIVPVSSEKLNAVSPYLIAPIAEISGMIASKQISSRLLEPYKQLGISITEAGD
jgi:DeoR/GlpR family transcriptional regulator of sugar metabolism